MMERYSIQLTQGSRALRGLGLSGNSLLGGYTNPTPPHLDFTITITRPMPAFGLRRESFPTCQNKFSIDHHHFYESVNSPKEAGPQTPPHSDFTVALLCANYKIIIILCANHSQVSPIHMVYTRDCTTTIISELVGRVGGCPYPGSCRTP